jgi:hypothetical protein
MKNKKRFKLGVVDITMHENGFPKGLVLKRDVTTREARYILSKLLGFVLMERNEYDSYIEYADDLEYQTHLVNDWLKGDTDDDNIVEIAGDCSDEKLGLINMVPILSYLKKKGIIE